MKNNNIYYATDKNIFDALHHKRVTAKILHELLFSKGIILSGDLDKELLIDEMCRLPLCFTDLEKIKKLVQTYDARESNTYVKLNTSVSQAEVKQAAESVKRQYASKSQMLNIKTKKNGSMTIELNYQEIDLSRTELRQIDNRCITLDFNISDGVVDIRMPQSEKSKELVGLIQKELATITSNPIERFELSLEAITNPRLRSQFFKELMDGLDGYEVDDVTNIELNQMKTSDSDNDEDKESEIDTGFVKKVLLKGEAVDTSAIFAELHSKGYYISRVSWAAKPESVNGDRIQVEAYFKNADTCSDFSYQIRGINNYRNDRHNLSTRAASDIEKKEISRLIENAAENAYNMIKI
ncbi:hypothetical protein ACNSPB_26735 [Yersinia enterocolitica]|uniref:hypothetical protein n=1 Tax=Yersinia mollaretii TaxID=33060 RepID=UPI0011A044D2|nr:hypothetical protein [Yersinia mollaretii]EKN5020704.1 hypothetical protein [Yersinia enterocolitica]EKN5068341.1 hypothetical protein [Yersinia enterocolitica]EKN5130701.1 hypothetical protein [Yersinia enterocolitica]HDL6990074.1 hypothetical protein [Yersinia enterocolitica]HDL6999462.1 hypothetical protein [Yersinia enterocolitica]